MHETTPKYHLLQAEKTANIVQLTSYPLYFEKLFVASAGTTNLARGRGGGYSDNFIHMKAWTNFFWFNILNFNIFVGFQKMKMFWGMKILWTFKGSSQKGSFLCILGRF